MVGRGGRKKAKEKAEKGGDVEMRHFSYMHMNIFLWILKSHLILETYMSNV